MRHVFVALALAGALGSSTAAWSADPAPRVAQMSRDVTGAVRAQRGRHNDETPPRNGDCKDRSRR